MADLTVWKAYLATSVRQRKADQEFLKAELKAHNLINTTEPKSALNADGLILAKPGSWYAGEEARRLAENLVSLQTPAGGWCKNTDFTNHRRMSGEMFSAGLSLVRGHGQPVFAASRKVGKAASVSRLTSPPV